MSEPEPSSRQPVATTPGNLHHLAQLLRQADHLDPAVQQELATLLEELAGALPATAELPDAAHLLGHVAEVARALHQQHDSGILTAARDRLEKAAVRAELEAPLATGIARRLIDVLANLGI
jgi:hypothetical protein